MQAALYTREQQGTGQFDGGKITERKPVGFPGEKSAVLRVGPLFYWSWAFAKEEGYIPPHPHQGFEIVTYVVSGRTAHGDSLGTRSEVGAGGAQVMQTGSGVYHEERFIGPDMEAFQIWFEPNLRETLLHKPTYRQYEPEEFPVRRERGYALKSVIGGEAPIRLVSDVRMFDLTLEPGETYEFALPAGRSLAALAIRGGGQWTWEAAEGTAAGMKPFGETDFMVLQGSSLREERAAVTASGQAPSRLILIEAPTHVNYPLLAKR